MLNLVCYVSLCEGLHAGAGSLSYIVNVDCCGLSTIVIKKIIIIIIIIIFFKPSVLISISLLNIYRIIITYYYILSHAMYCIGQTIISSAKGRWMLW